MNIRIGEVIKQLRNKNKHTQKALACYLGVTEQAISRWESGTGYPDIELLPAIAQVFSVTVDYLLGVDKTEKDNLAMEAGKLLAQQIMENTIDNTGELLK